MIKLPCPALWLAPELSQAIYSWASCSYAQCDMPLGGWVNARRLSSAWHSNCIIMHHLNARTELLFAIAFTSNLLLHPQSGTQWENNFRLSVQLFHEKMLLALIRWTPNVTIVVTLHFIFILFLRQYKPFLFIQKSTLMKVLRNTWL